MNFALLFKKLACFSEVDRNPLSAGQNGLAQLVSVISTLFSTLYLHRKKGVHIVLLFFHNILNMP